MEKSRKEPKFYYVDKNFKNWHVPGTSRFHTSFDDTKEGRPLCQANKISKIVVGGKRYEKTGFIEKGRHACVSGGDDDRRHVNCVCGNRPVETERCRMAVGEARRRLSDQRLGMDRWQQ